MNFGKMGNPIDEIKNAAESAKKNQLELSLGVLSFFLVPILLFTDVVT